MGRTNLNGVPVDEDRMPALMSAAKALGLSPEGLLGVLSGHVLAHEPRELQVIACFERGWRGHRDAGGRLGNKVQALGAWKALLRRTGWEPKDGLARWARFVKLTPGQFLPEVKTVLLPSEQKLTDDALTALEKRRRFDDAMSKRDGTAAFSAETYESTLARRRAASAQIPGGMFTPPPETESEETTDG